LSDCAVDLYRRSAAFRLGSFAMLIAMGRARGALDHSLKRAGKHRCIAGVTFRPFADRVSR
jgi:hypothetical protein